MNNTSNSLLRMFGFSALVYILINLGTSADNRWFFAEDPILWLVLLVLITIVVAAELSLMAIRQTLFKTLTKEQRESYERKEITRKENRFAGLKRWSAKMLDKKPVSREEEIVLDHNYDGIRELDNNLPPWWVYLFYATIVFAGIYLVYYEIMGGPSQYEEYEKEVAVAELAIAKYKAENKDIVDASTVEMLQDASDLKAGQATFEQLCVACHMADGGGGIGPNLTDEYWIMGGGIKNVYHTISEGGRPGKGMVPWKDQLKPNEIAQVASYVLSLQGSTPANPKEPQGDKWDRGDEYIH